MKRLLPYIFLLLLSACSEKEEATVEKSDDVAIAFFSDATESEDITSRSTLLNKDFQLYGFKTSATYCQTVFDDYTVKYAAGSGGSTPDNTNGYYYVGTFYSKVQTIKYWDMSAERYQFFAFSPRQTVTYSGTGTGLSDGSTYSAMMTITKEQTDNGIIPLYSELKEVVKAGFGNVVTMVFKRPISLVAYRFLSEEGVAVTVDNSSFEPATASDKIYSDGTATVTYSSSRATLVTQGTTVLNAGTENENKFTSPETYYAVMPAGETPYGAFKVTAAVQGVKTAYVPAEFMQWKPNCRYTYVFKVSGSSVPLVLVDVVVEEWQYGGYVEDEQNEW